MGNNNKLLPIAKDCGGELNIIAIKGEYFYFSTQKTHCQARNKHIFIYVYAKSVPKGWSRRVSPDTYGKRGT